MVKILASIPVINEASNLLKLIPDLMQIEDLYVSVVDDFSTDETFDVCTKFVQVYKDRFNYLRNSTREGFAAAHIYNYKLALNGNFDFVMQMDADLSHRVIDAIKLIDSIEAPGTMLIGSRYIKGGQILNWPLRRKFLSYSANFGVRILTGIPFLDSTSGFKLVPNSIFQNIIGMQNGLSGYVFQVATLKAALSNGTQIKEVPIVFFERVHGKSKMNYRIILEGFLYLIINNRFKKN